MVQLNRENDRKSHSTDHKIFSHQESNHTCNSKSKQNDQNDEEKAIKMKYKFLQRGTERFAN